MCELYKTVPVIISHPQRIVSVKHQYDTSRRGYLPRT